MALIVPFVVFGMLFAPVPMPRDPEPGGPEGAYDCHDSGECFTAASIPRPNRPRRVRVVAVAGTSVTVSWQRARSGRVAGYEVVLNGARVAVVRGHRFTFTALTCATRYRITIRAVGANGRRSHRRTVFGTTSACPPGSAPAPAPLLPSPASPVDSQPPSTPGSLRIGTVATTAIQLRWAGSTDNVGVSGYRMLLDGAPLDQGTTSLSFTFTGLACGKRYTLGVQAFDAVGNASPTATRTASTAACPPPPSAADCPANPKQGVQVPSNLTVLDPATPCRTATGRVTGTQIEPDGDCHVNVSVDPQFDNLLNAVNGGLLVTEVIPNHPLAIPTVGSRVSVFGSWVNDHASGWNELHPVWSFDVLSGSTGTC